MCYWFEILPSQYVPSVVQSNPAVETRLRALKAVELRVAGSLIYAGFGAAISLLASTLQYSIYGSNAASGQAPPGSICG